MSSFLNNAASNKGILIHERQKPNKQIISLIKNVPFEFVPASSNVPADFIPNGTTAILFLSLKYHLLHPGYIVKSMKQFPKPSVYKLKIVLLFVNLPVPSTPVDIPSRGSGNDYAHSKASHSNPSIAFVELNNSCFQSGFTLLCAFSEIECARYIETFKAYENKSTTSIQEKAEVDFLPQVTKFLTTNIPGLNKTDVITLLETYGDVATLSRQSEHDLLLIPGIGDTKAKRIYKLFHSPFGGVSANSASSAAGDKNKAPTAATAAAASSSADNLSSDPFFSHK